MINTIEELIEEIMDAVWFRKLDELPYAIKRGSNEESQRIFAEAKEILKEELSTALTRVEKEAYARGREDGYKDGYTQGRFDVRMDKEVAIALEEDEKEIASAIEDNHNHHD